MRPRRFAAAVTVARVEGRQIRGAREQAPGFPRRGGTRRQPVRHDVKQQPQAALGAEFRQHLDPGARIEIGSERRMQPREIRGQEEIAGAARQEGRGDQDMVKAESGRVVEQGRPAL